MELLLLLTRDFEKIAAGLVFVVSHQYQINGHHLAFTIRIHKGKIVSRQQSFLSKCLLSVAFYSRKCTQRPKAETKHFGEVVNHTCTSSL